MRPRNLILAVFLILLFAPAAVRADDDQAAFARAYEQGVKNQPGALASFEQLLERYPADPDLLFDAGTTALANRQLGKAMLYLERAAIVSPRAADIRANLERAREVQADRVVLNTNDKVLSGGGFNGLLDGLGADLLAVITAVLGTVAGVCFAWRLFTRKATRRFALALGLAVSLLAEAAVGGLLWLKLSVAETERYAVVMPAELSVRKGPNLNYPEAFKVHEGLKVKLGETVEDYVQIVLANGLNGYAPHTSLSDL